MDAVAAIALTRHCVFGYVRFTVFEFDVCDGKIMRILRDEVSPRAVYDVQVCRNNPAGINEFIDDPELLREAQEGCARASFGNPHHHPKVCAIGNVAGAVIAKKPCWKCCDLNVALETIRIIFPDIEVPSNDVLDILEPESTPHRVALLMAAGLKVACFYGRQINRGYGRTEFADTVGYVNVTDDRTYHPRIFLYGENKPISSSAFSVASSRRSR